MGVLDKRAPIIAKLAICDVRIKLDNGEEVYRVVDGFIHCDGKSKRCSINRKRWEDPKNSIHTNILATEYVIQL